MKKPILNLAIIQTILIPVLLPFSMYSQQLPVSKNDGTDKLYMQFLTPPDSAKPLTWWHWTAGNVTKEGITKDLEWMKRVGIGGFMMFDVSFGFGQNVPKKLVVFTPEWFDALKHTASEAERLGLEMTMHISAGWSETGGPWVRPEEAIKKLVWSETKVRGPQKFSGILPQPPMVNGPIRDLIRSAGILSGSSKDDPVFYADSRIIAYRIPEAESDMSSLKPKISSSGGNIDGSFLLDESLSTKVTLPKPTDEKPAWIQFEFEKPYTARAFSIALRLSGSYGSSNMRPGFVRVSDDGIRWKTIVSMPGAQHDIRAIPVRTFSFPEVSARFFRVEFIKGSGISTVGGPDDPGFMGGAPGNTFNVLEARFYSDGRVNRWEDKANFAPMFEFESLAGPAVSSNAVLNQSEILDITSGLTPDGRLNWEVPPGNWNILRFGYSLTGAKNGPAVAAGTGYEVDKFSKGHMESYYSGYTKRIKEALGPLYGKALQYYLVDSYEADAQNWTDEMTSEFKKRRGYDLTPYLPVLAGHVVTSSEVSDRFLWDFRRTIADLLADEHYGAVARLAHQDGIKIYGESAGISLPIIEDALQNKGRMDIPMGEFGMAQGLGSDASGWMSPADLEKDHSWRGAGDRMNAHQADVREAASAAHIYGKTFVGAESWTGGGYEAPASMKLIGDYWNTQGINRFIFHTSAHQPLDTKPGNAMVGTHINRNITWAEQAKPFMTYLTRNSYMLQQGHFVADIVYYLGEGIPSAVPYWKKLQPEPPAGYDYDFINTEVLLENVSVEDGLIVLKSGMKYHLLVLPETEQMTPKVLNKIRALIAAGAIVVGPKPLKSPGLAGYPAVDNEIVLLANEIWGDADGKMIYQHAYGKGKVYWGIPLTGPLVDLKVQKDFDYTTPHTNTYLTWIHRRATEADIYFITNMRNQGENLEVTLRAKDKVPELWHSDSGLKEPVSYFMKEGLTTISLSMDPQESVFVVLRELTQNQSLQVNDKISEKPLEISGEWNMTFQPDLGAPAGLKMEKLISWSENPDEGIKYFSGTAIYTKILEVSKSWFNEGTKLILDLGDVKDIAEVSLNRTSIGTLWKAPYTIDVTDALKKGENRLEIKVTNQWNNRITGDRKLPAGKKILSGSGFSFGSSTGTAEKLEKSGLLGPVRLLSVSNE